MNLLFRYAVQMRILFVLILSLVFVTPSFAVIKGSTANPFVVSTFKIMVDQMRWYAPVNGFIVETNECSSVVVGTAPLTVLTAAHCLRNARLNAIDKTPMMQLLLGAKTPPLRKAIYSDYDDLQENLARDIAVLIFAGNAPEGITATPVTTMQVSDIALLCGFGKGYLSSINDAPSCAEKKLFKASDDFEQFVPTLYQRLDPQLYLQFQAQFDAKKLLLRSSNNMLAVNRLSQNEYDRTLPMPTQGDLGGPWIIGLPNSKRAVVALTSFVETFYRKNKQWSFLKKTSAPLSQFPYVAYGVRLDTDEAQSLFKQARMFGADISVLP